MKPWIPFALAMVIGVLINLVPVFMAFVVGDPGWVQAGWALYFFTIPTAIALFVIGLIITMVLDNRQSKKSG